MSMIFDAARQTNNSPRGQHIHATGKDRTRRQGAMATILILATGLCASMTAQAAIPVAERQALLNLYTGTNGGAWTHNSGWNGTPGTECAWYGITCDTAGEHVTQVNLPSNNLDGSLPSLTSLMNLEFFAAGNNQLTGSLPSLAGLVNLSYFSVGANQLSGPIPSLAGLANLSYFNVYVNQLTGSIPSLAGLNLSTFNVGVNQLTGPIPSLAGLTNLHFFYIHFNQLTGSIPSLADLATLSIFYVGHNQLTGHVPSLENLTNLREIFINDNHLSGPMPSVPNPSMLEAGGSTLCVNHLDPVPDADWDAATGEIPWYQNCTPLLDEIFADGFDP